MLKVGGSISPINSKLFLHVLVPVALSPPLRFYEAIRYVISMAGFPFSLVILIFFSGLS